LLKVDKTVTTLIIHTPKKKEDKTDLDLPTARDGRRMMQESQEGDDPTVFLQLFV
jgi:hypothetical protein